MYEVVDCDSDHRVCFDVFRGSSATDTDKYNATRAGQSSPFRPGKFDRCREVAFLTSSQKIA